MTSLKTNVATLLDIGDVVWIEAVKMTLTLKDVYIIKGEGLLCLVFYNSQNQLTLILG